MIKIKFKTGDKVQFKSDDEFADVWTIESGVSANLDDPWYNLIRNNNNFSEGYESDLKKIKTDKNSYYIQNIKCCKCCYYCVCVDDKCYQCSLNTNSVDELGICDSFKLS